ncbi:hypothetical protein CGGC5_v011234 [Colletotrichum fructicola Nara gc5]|uniref:Uncharacterized protein n=1 Tax=Colletotrichum fructicola (strain Nara gc5) TaxID=1213859 RepID=A0A7J6ILV4_COLFN|nr:hypothetical protein CGGC5_v017068 [Colletotrichum fructicola Nara gc5]KAF4477740.1 hypothetical protein CGGC5_v013840 [Colletotrichum fructicola Nara gc5]KAF4480328.1 hypothetical protein CGGC5_v011234 [Colletotrichum fructicola Nara gc5]
MFVHYVQSFRSYHIAARAIHPPPISFALANQQPRTNELLWLASYEVLCPSRSDTRRVTFVKETIGHISITVSST